MNVTPISHLTRRRFLKQTTATAASALVYPVGIRAAQSKDKLRLAAVGVGGKGWTDVNGAAQGGEIVAFCDVETGDIKRKGGFGEAAEQWPKAHRYTDWRKMLDKEHKNLDGITVSTPDHMHAPVTMTAIHLGLATYTQKPLTRTIFEARQLTKAAQNANVVTQMGNQNHSKVEYRQLVQIIQQGTIGKIREAHAWTNRPIWPQGINRPAGKDKVSSGFNWNQWLGVAPKRPYLNDTYHPFKWRGWFDFGAGALGDMGCHIIDPVVWALELGPAQSAQYHGPKPKPETFPEWEIIKYVFPGTERTTGSEIEVTWYDGGKLPPRELALMPEGTELPSQGTLFLGEEGTIVTGHVSTPKLYPEEKFRDVQLPTLDQVDHYLQWTDAIHGIGSTSTGFDYSGPLTETVLLGTVAARFPNTKLEWNSKALEFTNLPKANDYVHAEYRKGWKVEGLS